MINCFVAQKKSRAIPIIPVLKTNFTKWISTQSKEMQNQVATFEFSAKPNSYCLILDAQGKLNKILLGIEDNNDYLAFALLTAKLPENVYKIDASNWTQSELTQAAIGWGMGSYKFTKYKKAEKTAQPKLVLDSNYDWQQINTILDGIFLVRDLINTPAEDMTPTIFAAVAAKIAKKYGANFKQIIGKNLITNNFPAIYAVGRASINSPRLVEINWSSKQKNAPSITLVGKGVCFDSGGIDIKTPPNMLLMKKDMAGAAHALALAQMIMVTKLPVNLRVILPLAENLVSGNSFKPGDVIKMRNGKTVEVKDTDAEGRLILADALAYASEKKSDLLIDFATLTGAARVALGSEIASLFTPNEHLAQDLIAFGKQVKEYFWRLPLHKPYRDGIKSKIADLVNLSTAVQGAGAIIAALFLQEFVANHSNWVHFDMTCHNFSASPGKPEGGEAMCLQAVYNYLMYWV